MKAIILAAGYGKRLQPLTLTTPKPLIEVVGKPLIVYHLEKIAEAGIKEVIINISWLGNQIIKQLGNGEKFGLKIRYSNEEKPLETAGGIINALPLLEEGVLKNQGFLVVNADIYTDYVFKDLLNLKDRDCPLHLVLVDTPPSKLVGDFSLQGNQVIEKREGSLTFSGISVMKPSLFSGYRTGKLALLPVFKKTILERKVSGEYYQGFWSDMGTLNSIKKVTNILINGGVK